MSFDLFLWHPSRSLVSDDDVRASMRRLLDVAFDPEAQPPEEKIESEDIAAFVAALSDAYPPLDELSEGDIERSPWSCALERGDRHIYLCMVWSVGDEVLAKIAALAETHGLILYDPQGDQVHYPR